MNGNLSYENRDGVHIFTLYKSSHDTVDRWLEILHLITLKDAVVGYMLLDLSESGLPPIRYVMKAAYQWLKDHPQERKGYIAIIFRSGDSILPTLRAAASTLMVGRDAQVRFFSEQARDEAIAWLQEEQAKIG